MERLFILLIFIVVAVSAYERAENPPSSAYLAKLNENLNVNINWLLTGKGSMIISDNAEPYEDAIRSQFNLCERDINIVKNLVDFLQKS